MLPDKIYDALKWVCLILMPAAGTLIATLGGIWHWAYVQEVVATLVAVDTFLGVVLGISTHQYNKTLNEEKEGE